MHWLQIWTKSWWWRVTFFLLMACPPLICRTFGKLELLCILKATAMLFARMNNDFTAPVWPLALIADSPIAMIFASIPDLLFMVNKLSSAATKLNRSSIRTAIAERTSEFDLDVRKVQSILHKSKASAKSVYEGNWWWKTRLLLVQHRCLSWIIIPICTPVPLLDFRLSVQKFRVATRVATQLMRYLIFLLPANLHPS